MGAKVRLSEEKTKGKHVFLLVLPNGSTFETKSQSTIK
jgi:hypothetical protein